uniref:Uncharacterized protein n=1 Tax=Meloidogyne incognita TaxID=6306 RepID=A0A914LRW5_MELIC
MLITNLSLEFAYFEPRTRIRQSRIRGRNSKLRYYGHFDSSLYSESNGVSQILQDYRGRGQLSTSRLSIFPETIPESLFRKTFFRKPFPESFFRKTFFRKPFPESFFRTTLPEDIFPETISGIILPDWQVIGSFKASFKFIGKF